VIGPWRLNAYLQEFNQCEQIGVDTMVFVEARSLLNGVSTSQEHDDSPVAQDTTHLEDYTAPAAPRQTRHLSLLEDYGIKQLKTAMVDHCPNAFGISVILKATGTATDMRLVYSGDTRPCENLIQSAQSIGQESTPTVLVHEATFNDDLQAEAIHRRHSTVSEALMVGKAMKATATVLTHFSQRYPVLSTVQRRHQDDHSDMHVVMASDGMAIDLDGDLGTLDRHRSLVATVSKEGPSIAE
jgi:ribonuclease Z